MDISDPQKFFEDFPRLKKYPYPFNITSPYDVKYNCFAWAIGENNCRWDPSYGFFWPEECPREVTISAFSQAFATLGYKPCKDGRRETGYEKIVLYANKSGMPTHAARQLKNGKWASKLGKDIDIEHKVKDIEGPCYGEVTMYFRRPKGKM